MFSIVTIPRRLKSARVLWPPAVSEEATSCDVWACDFGTEFSSSLQRVLERRQATTASSEIGRRSTERSASSSCPDLVQVEVYTQVPLTIKISSDRQSITTTSCVLRMPVWLLGHREVAIIVWEVLRPAQACMWQCTISGPSEGRKAKAEASYVFFAVSSNVARIRQGYRHSRRYQNSFLRRCRRHVDR